MKPSKLVDLFQKARRDNKLAVIEGVQSLKHAVRFNAKILYIVTSDIKYLSEVLDELASDVKEDITSTAIQVEQALFDRLSPRPHRTKVIALSKRKEYSLDKLKSKSNLVLLENPKDLENIGAVIRVCAAVDAGAVLITGDIDIWHPAVIRGAAALQFALPVFNVSMNEIYKLQRPLISLDPDGVSIKNTKIKDGSILVFGTERDGISKEILNMSEQIISLPMKPRVSSLNLATSVSATLYLLKYL